MLIISLLSIYFKNYDETYIFQDNRNNAEHEESIWDMS